MPAVLMHQVRRMQLSRVSPTLDDVKIPASNTAMQNDFILGFRSWHLAPKNHIFSPTPKLKSLTEKIEWPHKHNFKAFHRYQFTDLKLLKERGSIPEHRVASQDCSCGYYAYHSRETLRLREGGCTGYSIHSKLIVRGLILGWGRVSLSTDGFKSEYARPVALINGATKDTDTDPKIAKALKQAAKLYRVPIIFDADIPAFIEKLKQSNRVYQLERKPPTVIDDNVVTSTDKACLKELLLTKMKKFYKLI